MRARRDKMEQAAEEGQRGARLSVYLIEHIDEYLSACQLGITLTSIGIGFLGEVALASQLEPLFGDVVSHGVAVAISIAIAYILVTSAHITVGEQVPKIFAITHAEATTRRIARPLQLFRVTFKPFITALNWASNGMLRCSAWTAAATSRRPPRPTT